MSIRRQGFYNGQRISKEEMDGTSEYTLKHTENIVSQFLGVGVVSGFTAGQEGGFALGINPGTAYNTQGQKLILEAGVQVNLADLAPSVGTKTVKVGALPAYLKTDPALDNEGNTVYKTWTQTTEFVKGEILPPEAMPFYNVLLSSSAILSITPIYPILETAKEVSVRTQGFENISQDLVLKGKSATFVRPDGFEVDLMDGVLRHHTFDLKHGAYKKGDIIWLEPPSYDTLTIPAGTTPASATSWMGKEHSYSEPTNYRQYAVRLRSRVDNNTYNPKDDQRYIGQYWAVDEPSAICEEGSNSNGNYTKYAGGTFTLWASVGGTKLMGPDKNDYRHTTPIKFIQLINVHPVALGGNHYWGNHNLFFYHAEHTMYITVMSNWWSYESSHAITYMKIDCQGTWY